MRSTTGFNLPPATSGEAREASVPRGGADVFENDVYAAFVGDAADFFADFLSFVIDEVVCAQLFGFLELFVAAGDGDDARAEESRDLNGGTADAAAGAEDQHLFAWLQFGARNEHVPRGLKDKRNRSSLFKRKIFGVGQAIYFGRANEFRVAAIDHVAEISKLAA